MQRFFRFVFMAFVIVFVCFSFVAPTFAGLPWEPYKGSSIVDQTRTEQRFTFSKSAVKELSSKPKCTYEQEVQIYHKDYADYGGNHRSDLPRYYRDTQRCDWGPFASGVVDNFAEGSAEASAIKAEKEYTTYIQLQKSSAKKTVKSATVRIKGQIGHRRIDFSWYQGRYSEWNTDPDATSPNSLLTFTAPSGKKFWGTGIDGGRVYARH